MLFDYYGQANRNIFICNFDCEESWSETKLMRLPSIDLHNIKSIIQNLDELFIFLARKEDILVLRRNPDNDFLSYLRSIGIEIPHILTVYSDDDKKSISELIGEDIHLINDLKEFVEKNEKERIITNLIPYGITKAEEKLSECISARLLSDSQISSFLNCKLTLKKMISKFDILFPESLVCDGIEDLQNEGMEFLIKHGSVVLKEIYGSGGSGLSRISDIIQFKKLIDHMKRLSQLEGKIILEKWYPSRNSYNHQYMFMDGVIYPHAFSKQLINNDNGKIIGSAFNRGSKNLTSVLEQHIELSRPIANEILNDGYQGLVGLDSIVCDEGLIFPVIDINCRINLSTIFYEIFTRYFSSSYACFFYKEYELDEPMSFAKLINRIRHTAYSSAKKEGIVILNFTSLNLNILRSKSKTGRVFYAMFAETEQRASEIYAEAFPDERLI